MCVFILMEQTMPSQSLSDTTTDYSYKMIVGTHTPSAETSFSLSVSLQCRFYDFSLSDKSAQDKVLRCLQIADDRCLSREISAIREAMIQPLGKQNKLYDNTNCIICITFSRHTNRHTYTRNRQK